MQTVDLAQDQRRPLIERKAVERLPDERGGFLAGQQPVREHVTLGLDVPELLQMLVERDLARTVTTPPPALSSASLIDDDAVDPGAQGRLPAEAGQRAEDAQEYFLRQVQGFVGVAKKV